MKRLVLLTSLAVIAWGSFRIWDVQTSYADPASDAYCAEPDPLPELVVGETREVEFDIDEGSYADLTERERLDQLRDWLLFLAVSTVETTIENVSETLFDLTPVRQGYLRPVAEFEYGETRSALLGDGRVVAILPARKLRRGVDVGPTPAGDRRDQLARIADEHLKNVGDRPRAILPFEYDIDVDHGVAHLTLQATVAAEALFSDASGYCERVVENAADLADLLGRTGTITYASVKSGHLVVGGRRLEGDRRPIRVEDVAALWQAEKKLQDQIDAFDKKWEEKEREFGETWHNNQAIAAFHAEREAEQKSLKLVNGTGFSLDPKYDYEGLTHYFDAIRPALLAVANESGTPIATSDVSAVADGLARKEQLPFLELEHKLERAGHIMAEALSPGIRFFKFQSARYDGELGGTEVGMVLFYTDLLAKMWALDYMGNRLGAHVADFVSMTHRRIPVIFEQEEAELPNTRLWFGPEDKGFQITSDRRSLLLGHKATRIYAAGSNELNPSVEVAPNASSEAFLGWWNDHFEEVARYERQYERLNEVMKWSLVLSWLNSADKGALLGFLQNVPVDRKAWFPDWARARPDLKFREWDDVAFYPRGHKGAVTEALPMLVSESYEHSGREYSLSGGVSLAGKELLKVRPSLSSEVLTTLRRSNLDYSASAGRVLRTLRGTSYKLESLVGRSRVALEGNAGIKLRARYSELAAPKFERVMARKGATVEIGTAAGETPVGAVRLSADGNAFRIGWKTGEIDAGHAFARRMSRADIDVSKLLANEPGVEAAAQLGKDGAYLVKMRGSTRWMEVAAERTPSSKIADGWQSRVADVRPGSKPLNLRWIDERAAQARLATPGVTKIRGVDEALQSSDVSRLSAALSEGRYADAARGIAGSPGDAGRKLRAHLDEGLRSLDELLAAGKSASARQLGETLAQIHGPRPEIALRHACADLSHGRLERAARCVEQATARPLKGADAFWKELNARATGAKYPPADRVNARRLADYAEWRDLQVRMKAPTQGSVGAHAEGDQLVLDIRLKSPLPAGVPAGAQAPAEIASGKARLYVQDSPRLNNLDFGLSVDRTLQQTISSGIGKLEALPTGDIAHFHPERIYGPEGTFHSVGVGKASLPSPHVPFEMFTGGGSGDDEDEGRRASRAYVLKVR